MLKKPPSSAAASLTPAIIVFLLVYVTAMAIALIVLTKFTNFGINEGVQIKNTMEALLLGSIILLPIPLAYRVSRIVHNKLRWQIADDNAGSRCDHCGYNLTGNKSGICPECGNNIDSNT